MSSLIVLVDGYNVLQGRYAEADRAALVARARTFRSSRPVDRIVIVFDTAAGEAVVQPGGRHGVVSVLYAAPDADTYLQGEMRRAQQPDAVVVVSDDRAIRDTARACGVQRMTVAQFLSALGAPAAGNRLAQPPPGRLASEAARRITDEQRRRFGL